MHGNVLGLKLCKTNYDACLYNSLIQQIIKYIISHVLLVLKTETKATFYMIQLSKNKVFKILIYR